jgi:hypothetical protein
MFTNSEYADIHFVYGFCNGNAKSASLEYARRFPERQAPNPRVFSAVHARLRETGSFVRRQREGFDAIDVQTEENILEAVRNSPGTSTRRLSNQLLVSKSKVWKVLKKEKMHPYHIQKVQALHPGDDQKRLTFCHWITTNRNVVKWVLFTDEAQFTRNGVNNSKNLHVWATENPHQTVENHFQRRFAINVWCGLINDVLVGPYIIEGNLNKDTYYEFLLNQLPTLLEDVPLEARANLWFQHDGAPPHSSRQARELLQQRYGQRVIANNGPVNWPARSPDLTPMDYFLWGWMKSQVYTTKPRTREELLDKIMRSAELVKRNPAIIRAATNSLVARARLCRQNHGNHFENFL